MTQFRANEVAKLMKVFEQDKNPVLNINGLWGTGKTYLSKKVEDELNKKNDYIALRINLCEYDYANDPLIPFYIVLLEYANTKINLDGESSEVLKTISKGLIILGGIAGLIDQSGTINRIMSIVKDYNEQKENKTSEVENTAFTENIKTIKAYREAIELLNKTVKLLKKKIIIFVDDFDRADPKFCYKTLNVIHQLKSIAPMLQICLIMNRAQFESQLKHVYGEYNHNDEHYLTKYIDMEYTTRNPSIDNTSIKDLLQELKMENIHDEPLLYSIFKKLSVREMERFSSKITNLPWFNDPTRLASTNPYSTFYNLIILFFLFIKNEFNMISAWHDLLNEDEVEILKNKLLKDQSSLMNNDKTIGPQIHSDRTIHDFLTYKQFINNSGSEKTRESFATNQPDLRRKMILLHEYYREFFE